MKRPARYAPLGRGQLGGEELPGEICCNSFGFAEYERRVSQRPRGDGFDDRVVVQPAPSDNDVGRRTFDNDDQAASIQPALKLVLETPAARTDARRQIFSLSMTPPFGNAASAKSPASRHSRLKDQPIGRYRCHGRSGQGSRTSQSTIFVDRNMISTLGLMDCLDRLI
jgi:hypothetical protein